MKKRIAENIHGRMLFFLLVLFSAAAVFGQTTEFTYQGKLTDTGAMSANYDFEFRLCSALAGDCAAPLAVFSQSNVAVATGGIFMTKINFGSQPFDGSDRFLEIAVRRAGETNYTTLAPRQKLTSAPYSIQSLKTDNALQLGGVAANQYVLTNDPRLSPTNYVQNGTTAQTGVNFNVGGTGTANAFNAGAQYNIGGERILSNAGTSNLFAGINSGRLNTSGAFNAFFGYNAGDKNADGSQNSFFGAEAGLANAAGSQNTFFGSRAGFKNTDGGSNSFFGTGAGGNNLTGGNNTFVGLSSGSLNSTGNYNTFLGFAAGADNTTGSNNTIIGRTANVGANNLTYATAIGAGAVVSSSNTLVLGRSSDIVRSPGLLVADNSFYTPGSITVGANGNISGNFDVNGNVDAGSLNTPLYKINNTTYLSNGGDFQNTYVGSNSNCPNASGSSAVGNTFLGSGTGINCTTGSFNTVIGYLAGSVGTGNNNTFLGYGARVADNTTVNNSTAVGYNATVSTSNTIVLGSTTQTTQIPGRFQVTGGVSGGAAIRQHLQTVVSTNSNWGEGVAVNSLHIGRVPQVFLDTPLCFQAGVGVSNHVSVGLCPSSLAKGSLKTDIKPYVSGIEVLKRLQPVSFKWKDNDSTGIGLNAEEVADVDANIVSRDANGEVLKVNESSLNAVLINAIQQQQKQIEAQARQIDELKKLVCAANGTAQVCQEKKDEK